MTSVLSTPKSIELQRLSQSYQPKTSAVPDKKKTNLQDEITTETNAVETSAAENIAAEANADETNGTEINKRVDQVVVQEVIDVQGKMDVPQEKVEAPDETELNNMAEKDIQPSPVIPSNQSYSMLEKPKEGKSMPLDKFKRRLVRAVARQIQQKKPEDEMWKELKKEIGCDCKMLWQHMRALTLKKLKRLLPANDLLANLKKVARFTATDWLLFDLILVHEKVNVISIRDLENVEEDNKEEPQCLHDLFELVKEHRVENLSGADLIEAWIRVTLQYNSRGRQCSPMLLQLRWFQLKELTRARFYNFWYAYRGNHKMLDNAMKVKPTTLQTLIAREYKNVITHMYPEWEKLIEERRVILSEEFTLNREAKRKAEKTREENDVEIEVIEPLVETIELEVDSDDENVNTEEKKSNIESSSLVDDNNKNSEPDSDKYNILSKNILNSASISKSESDDDVLELDGLSDMETMHIPLEKVDEKEYSQNFSENSTEQISKTNVNEILPKISNVIGNVVELTECTVEQEVNTITEKNARNDNEDIITETMIEGNNCTVTKDTSTVPYDSIDEINELLRQKANNLMNIEITQIKSECDLNEIGIIERNFQPHEKLQQEEEFNFANDASSNGNQIIQSDSDDEIDKLLQEKANNYIGIKTPKMNVEIIDKTFQENPNISEIESNECTNIHTNHVIDENCKIITDDATIKKEKHDDGFDEVEFDDDQIEFVDDGIEFVDEIEGDKNKKNDLKMEHLSESEDESITKIDDYAKIDLKLLMNPTVYTKKLDVMNIFKFTDYEFVNNKKVIECAILESKPVDKLALKDEDINKFREQTIRGYETDGTQSDSDIVQTPMEYENDRIKCTSWLLQKPKNRSYNPIQLCKNPDFNTRLKRLTAGFLSSTRNRVLLKECKPLTIDLHKTFERKLINGTMYLKSGDFKSAKSTTTDKTNNELVSVLPSVIPGQSMLFTTSITNNISTLISNNIDNHDDNLPLSSIVEKHIPNERRKIINLPDIDQVRRVNQSLLTAEVTPIRIENRINNTNTCEEPVKATLVEPAFVQPITFVPLAQIKNEPSESDLDDKHKLQSQLIKTQNENSSGKDLMANKINHQIINLSNQISEVDNNELLSIDVEKTVQKQPQIKNNLGRKPKDNVIKPKVAQQVNKLSYTPRYRCKLTWSPKYPKNHIADSLLTIDTLSKILFLLNGNEDEIKNCSCKQKKFLKEMHNDQQNFNKKGTSEVQSALTKCNDILKPSSANKVSIQRRAPRKKNRIPQIPPEVKKYNGIYCCWAREKIISITKDKPLDTRKHGCHVYQCQCCCRQELVTMTTWKSSVLPKSKNLKKISSTIILSDDEDMNKDTQNNKEIVTIPEVTTINKTVSESTNLENNPDASKVVTEQSDKITIEILIPPLQSVTKAVVSTDSPNTDAEISPENVSVDTEMDMVKKQKSCKTIVHAADGHAYNKRIQFINSNGKEDNFPITLNSAKSIDNIDKNSSKPIERTLFLNSSQILTKPTRSPIFLGKNKILLCSLKNPSVAATPTNPYLPVLPYGVHFVMLPNGELTLSIENGTHLDMEQLSALPALMSVVQEQFLKSSISNKTPKDTNILRDNDHVTIMDQGNVTKQNTTNSMESLDNNSKKIQDKSTQDDNSITSDKNVLSEGKNDLTELSNPNSKGLGSGVSLPLNSDNETSTQISVGAEINNIEPECEKSVEKHQITRTQIENQTTESQLPVENLVNIPQTTESLFPLGEQCLNVNNDGCENNNVNTRKTILSDLMEMSGISAEDTSMSMSDVINSCQPISTLPPTIIPVTRTSGSGTNVYNVPTNSNVPKNITVAGPYSNLLSIEPTTPINHLLNCIAQIRPELNAVTSFAELKYVHANDGRFYKLDVDSGVISEIKVFIKKNPKTDIPTIPKAFIDLTDDTDNENVTCAEFQDIPQDNQGNIEVKPIKLFKAVHPAILKRSGRSILKENEVVYPKKIIRINKQRRKQLLNIGNKYVLVDIEKKNEPIQPEFPPGSNLDSSYDSSDEEPLAKKSKRMKSVEENVEETIPLFVDTPELHNSVPEDLTGISDIPDMGGECGDTSDLEMNSMDIEGVNPELHPVAFEEGSESDEDMCILGV